MTGPFVEVPTVGETDNPTESVNVSRVTALRAVYRDNQRVDGQCFVVIDAGDAIVVDLSVERLSMVFNEATAHYAAKVAALSNPAGNVLPIHLLPIGGSPK